MLFLDCEFNGHGGKLISMALVGNPIRPHPTFYEVMHPNTYTPNAWVKENVVPKLNKAPISEEEFRAKLHNFLMYHHGETIYADSPADIVHLMDLCHEITKEDKYRYINMNIKMEFIISGNIHSEVPHNALSDAEALRMWYMNTYFLDSYKN